MIRTRIRGVSPDKTASFDKLGRWPIFLPAASLLKNDTKVTKTDTKVAAESALTGCFLFVIGQLYNILGDSVDETVSLAGQLTLLETIVPTAVHNNRNETTKTSLAAPSALPINAAEVRVC